LAQSGITTRTNGKKQDTNNFDISFSRGDSLNLVIASFGGVAMSVFQFSAVDWIDTFCVSSL